MAQGPAVTKEEAEEWLERLNQITITPATELAKPKTIQVIDTEDKSLDLSDLTDEELADCGLGSLGR